MSQKDPPFLEPIKKTLTFNDPWFEWFREVQTNMNTLILDDGVKDNIPVFDGAGGLEDSGKAIPDGAVVGTTDFQTLSNKIITAPVVTNGVFTSPTLVDPILFGLLADMPLGLNAALEMVNVYGHKVTIVNHTADVTLTVSDLRKVHIFDCSVGERAVTLPSVAASNLGEWVEFARTGAYRLRIFAADSDQIMDSKAGGSVESFDTVHSLHRIGLRLLEAAKWWFGFENFGVWATR